MGLVLLYNFNENNTATIRDYSENKADSDDVGGSPSIQAGEIAREMVFGAASCTGISTNTNVLEGLTKCTIFIRFFIGTSGSNQRIAEQQGIFGMTYNSGTTNLAVSFTTDAGTASYSGNNNITSGYHDIEINWDGANVNLLLDGASLHTSALAGTTPSTSNQLCLGADWAAGPTYTLTMEGRIGSFWAWNKAITSAQRTVLRAQHEGIDLTTNGEDHTLEPGDLIIQSPDRTGEAHGIVTHDLDANSVLVAPLSANHLKPGLGILRYGHRWDTARQDVLVVRNQAYELMAEVSTFSEYTADANKVLIADDDGVRFKYLDISTTPITLKNRERDITVDASGGVRTVNLPATPKTGQTHVITDNGSAGTNTITVQGNGKNINGSASDTLTTNYESKTYRYNGTEWNII